MDRGAPGATVHGVTKSWTQLSTHSLSFLHLIIHLRSVQFDYVNVCQFKKKNLRKVVQNHLRLDLEISLQYGESMTLTVSGAPEATSSNVKGDFQEEEISGDEL